MVDTNKNMIVIVAMEDTTAVTLDINTVGIVTATEIIIDIIITAVIGKNESGETIVVDIQTDTEMVDTTSVMISYTLSLRMKMDVLYSQ